MEYLPPLIGEKRCREGRPCELVSLDTLVVTLVAQSRHPGSSAELKIDCGHRVCALQKGSRTARFTHEKHLAGFAITDREFDVGNRAVLVYPSEAVGEILLGY